MENVKPDYVLHFINQLPYVYSWSLIFSTLIVSTWIYMCILLTGFKIKPVVVVVVVVTFL